MDDAWEEFIKHTRLTTEKARQEEWWRIIGKRFPGKLHTDVTPSEWGAMRAEMKELTCPF